MSKSTARYDGHKLNCRAVHCGSRGEYYLNNDWQKECNCGAESTTELTKIIKGEQEQSQGDEEQNQAVPTGAVSKANKYDGLWGREIIAAIKARDERHLFGRQSYEANVRRRELAELLAELERPPATPQDGRRLPKDSGAAGLRPITDADLTATANESYQLGRRHGKDELADEIETLIYWLLRCYQSGHREGWEKGPTTQETMDSLLDVLANRGYDPNEDVAAQELIARIEKR